MLKRQHSQKRKKKKNKDMKRQFLQRGNTTGQIYEDTTSLIVRTILVRDTVSHHWMAYCKNHEFDYGIHHTVSICINLSPFTS